MTQLNKDEARQGRVKFMARYVLIWGLAGAVAGLFIVWALFS